VTRATIDPSRSPIEAGATFVLGVALVAVAIYSRRWVRRKYGPDAPSAYYGGVMAAWFFAVLLIASGIGSFVVQMTR